MRLRGGAASNYARQSRCGSIRYATVGMVEEDGEKAFVGLTRLKIVARLQGGGTSYYARAQAFVGL
jgi:hypothetical protein